MKGQLKVKILWHFVWGLFDRYSRNKNQTEHKWMVKFGVSLDAAAASCKPNQSSFG